MPLLSWRTGDGQYNNEQNLAYNALAQYILVHLAVVVIVLGSHAGQRCGRLVQRAADGRRQSPENLGICEGFAIGSGQFTNSFSSAAGLVGKAHKRNAKTLF